MVLLLQSSLKTGAAEVLPVANPEPVLLAARISAWIEERKKLIKDRNNHVCTCILIN